MSDTPKTTAADAYETMEALLCEMQGLRDELVDVKRERDQARDKCHKLRIERAAADRAYHEVCKKLEASK